MKDSIDREKATGFWFCSILISVFTYLYSAYCVLFRVKGQLIHKLGCKGSVLVFKNLLRKLGGEISSIYHIRLFSLYYPSFLFRKTYHTVWDYGESWHVVVSKLLGFWISQPYLPNTEFVGGLHCKPAKPLPKVIKHAYYFPIGVFIS